MMTPNRLPLDHQPISPLSCGDSERSPTGDDREVVTTQVVHQQPMHVTITSGIMRQIVPWMRGEIQNQSETKLNSLMENNQKFVHEVLDKISTQHQQNSEMMIKQQEQHSEMMRSMLQQTQQYNQQCLGMVITGFQQMFQHVTSSAPVMPQVHQVRKSSPVKKTVVRKQPPRIVKQNLMMPPSIGTLPQMQVNPPFPGIFNHPMPSSMPPPAPPLPLSHYVASLPEDFPLLPDSSSRYHTARSPLPDSDDLSTTSTSVMNPDTDSSINVDDLLLDNAQYSHGSTENSDHIESLSDNENNENDDDDGDDLYCPGNAESDDTPCRKKGGDKKKLSGERSKAFVTRQRLLAYGPGVHIESRASDRVADKRTQKLIYRGPLDRHQDVVCVINTSGTRAGYVSRIILDRNDENSPLLQHSKNEHDLHSQFGCLFSKVPQVMDAYTRMMNNKKTMPSMFNMSKKRKK